jgi:hypothetical protein
MVGHKAWRSKSACSRPLSGCTKRAPRDTAWGFIVQRIVEKLGDRYREIQARGKKDERRETKWTRAFSENY